MTPLRNAYAQKALSQIPRILGNLDRNEYSPTYGCFHRDYWLDKTSDFPDAVRQFGVHALALVWKHDFPNNVYKNNDKIKDWAISSILFWCKIQHSDGSFDEFYPYERGWVGPSAFTCFTIIEAFNILRDEIDDKNQKTILEAIKKTAYFIADGEAEEDHLANHHAMATLALWKAYVLLKDERLKESYKKAFDVFLTYHNSDEGWSREYDGIDPGYLSATVSFLGKVYQDNKDERIKKVLEESIETCALFAYPNGFYAGSLGSRNTLHFYCHGMEIMSKENATAEAIAEKMLVGLSENKLVPPEIISDRYLFYRVPEFLQAYTDYSERKTTEHALPYEKKDFRKELKEAKFIGLSKNNHYIAINMAKGGVIKIFDLQTGELKYNDCGMIGKLNNGEIVTTQWIDKNYKLDIKEDKIKISGRFNNVPANKLFTPLKNIIFRSILVLLGWSPRFSHFFKGQIRKMLILNKKNLPIKFEREIKLKNDKIEIKNKVKNKEGNDFAKLTIGGEFFVRYVPQSRYFQSQELDIKQHKLSSQELSELKQNKKLSIKKIINL